MQRPYPRDRLIEERPEGFVVIVPVDAEPAVPISCPVCDVLFRSREDEQSYRELACCHWCALRWAHARRKEWTAGWRPTPEQVTEAEKERPPLLVTLDVG